MDQIKIGNNEISSESMGNLNFSITLDFVSEKSSLTDKDIWLLLDAFSPIYAICNPKSSNETRQVFTYILGELIENVVKFSDKNHQKGNMVVFHDYDNAFKLELTNTSSNIQTEKFEKHLNKLASNDLNDLMLEQFESNFKNPSENKSEVGLLNILTSYMSKLTVATTKSDDNTSQIVLEMITPKH
jgi:hypothetical protein